MSAAESLGSHQLNSFAVFLEDKLHTSSENSIVQNPQLKKMADGKKPQKGGKKLEVNTAFENPWSHLCRVLHSWWGNSQERNEEGAHGAHSEDWTKMGTRMDGIQICYSKVHEEINSMRARCKRIERNEMHNCVFLWHYHVSSCMFVGIVLDRGSL